MTANHDREKFRLLTMCTANQCRSPMAEVLAVRLLADHDVDAEVTSCGLLEGGVPASPGAVRAVGRLGLDLSRHVSRSVTHEMIVGSDLVIAMERRHIVAIAEICLDAVDRTFTLPELADLAVTVGRRHSDQSIGDWIASVASMRSPTAALSVNTGDDVADPMGGPRSAYRRSAEHIQQLLESVLDSAFPRQPHR